MRVDNREIDANDPPSVSTHSRATSARGRRRNRQTATLHPAKAIETPERTTSNPNHPKSALQPPSTPRTPSKTAAQPPSTSRALSNPQNQRQPTRTPRLIDSANAAHLRHRRPPSTNKRPCHIGTRSPSTTAEAKEEVGRGRHRRSHAGITRGGTRGDREEDGQGDEEGEDSAPLVRPVPPSATPLYERGCAHPTRRPLLSLVTPRCPFYYYYLLYYMYY